MDIEEVVEERESVERGMPSVVIGMGSLQRPTGGKRRVYFQGLRGSLTEVSFKGPARGAVTGRKSMVTPLARHKQRVLSHTTDGRV